MRFEFIWAFLLLIPLFAIAWVRLFRFESKQILFPWSIPAHLAQSDPGKKLTIIRVLAFLCLIIALARPQGSHRNIERNVSGIDIILVLDVSASMYIEDLGERNRFEIAKETMENFVKARTNDRIGYVIFSGEPLTLVPPTLDYGVVLKAIRDTEIGLLKDGTAIGDGLAVAIGHLRNSSAKSRVIILLTDGDNNVGQLDPGTSGEMAHGFGIKVYSIAIGREGRVKLPIRHKTPFGNTVTSYQWMNNALNPELLQQISKLTGGKFYRITEVGALSSVFKEIDQLEKTQIQTHEKISYEERFLPWLLAGLFLIALERLVASFLFRRLP
jgi:Ca-activated chloride channel family protein